MELHFILIVFPKNNLMFLFSFGFSFSIDSFKKKFVYIVIFIGSTCKKIQITRNAVFVIINSRNNILNYVDFIRIC